MTKTITLEELKKVHSEELKKFTERSAKFAKRGCTVEYLSPAELQALKDKREAEKQAEKDKMAQWKKEMDEAERRHYESIARDRGFTLV